MQSSQSLHPGSPSRNTIALTAQPTTSASDDARRLGYEMGIFAAKYWASVKNSERFRYMTIADYRDQGIAQGLALLCPSLDHFEYTVGYEMGFEDEAFDLAEAGAAGFEDVRAAGSVDGSVAVTARRLLQMVVDAGLHMD